MHNCKKDFPVMGELKYLNFVAQLPAVFFFFFFFAVQLILTFVLYLLACTYFSSIFLLSSCMYFLNFLSCIF